MIEINLLPNTSNTWLAQVPMKIMPIFCSIGCVLLCLWTGHIWLKRVIHDQKLYQVSLLQTLEEKRKQRKLLNEQLRHISEIPVFTPEYQFQRKIFSAFLKKVSTFHSDQACLTQIEWSKKSIHLIGYASSFTETLTLIKHYQLMDISPFRLIEMHYHTKSGNQHFHWQGAFKDDFLAA